LTSLCAYESSKSYADNSKMGGNLDDVVKLAAKMIHKKNEKEKKIQMKR